MQISIKNCNNITDGTLQIDESLLNIKFWLNGTGKSTIAKAIRYQIESPEKLSELMPFGLSDSESVPEITVPTGMKSVLIFNEEYLDQFTYRKDELVANSFEIFIKTPDYASSVEKIEQILEDIRKVFSENSALETMISDFESLSKSFATTQTWLSKSSAIYKWLQGGNKIEHIPAHLMGYSSFLRNTECVSWLDWQMKGGQFIDISDDCPYCTSPTPMEKKETIKSVSTTYDKTVIKNLATIVDAISRLGDYFTEDVRRTLESIVKKHSDLESGEMEYIFAVKWQIDGLLLKLRSLKDISSKSFKDENEAKIMIEGLIINMKLFDRFWSEKTEKIIDSLNGSLNVVLSKIWLLKGEVAKHKRLIRRLIETHEWNMNAFFLKAWYKYCVEITDKDSEEYKLKLRHLESKTSIAWGDQHLSYGERNAFALVLFMYEVISKNPDLTVLDDPISSFDKNKKYAIMDMLFKIWAGSDKSLKWRTVLMLTHDIEPVIDAVKVLHTRYGNLVSANFISSMDGRLIEKKICRNDIMSFAQICHGVVQSSVDDIIKLIYLRRLYESSSEKEDGYEVLSNLIHKRPRQDAMDARVWWAPISEEVFWKGVAEVKLKLPNFDYDHLQSRIADNAEVIRLYWETEDSYVKIALFRILQEGVSEWEESLDTVLTKFINESYHIENEMLFQLNPREFDVVPKFIVDWCDAHAKLLENGSYGVGLSVSE